MELSLVHPQSLNERKCRGRIGSTNLPKSVTLKVSPFTQPPQFAGVTHKVQVTLFYLCGSDRTISTIR